ncbi:MAG: TlpA disulfide reductase family protein [Sphaerochaeta sp.]|nr:TlpA disulfide reductase family protein [Sphaerochaeta sp.]
MQRKITLFILTMLFSMQFCLAIDTPQSSNSLAETYLENHKTIDHKDKKPQSHIEQEDVNDSKNPSETISEEAPKMPDIPLFTLDGEETSFDAVRQGKPAIINYFASWVPPCKQELPHFLAAYETHGDEISFIFLNAMDGQRETLETLTKFMEEFPFTGPVFTDEGVFAYIFQTNSLPTTVFFNADGTISNGYLGYVSETALQENLEILL